MKKTFLTALFLSSCSVGSPVVTMEAFYEIDLAATTPQVLSSLGKPYAIREKEDGCVEYEYIERIKIGNRDAEERHYFILIKNGAVISKRVKQSSPLPYGFDSYEMQTTQQLSSDEQP
ncbi:MAG: hypothetical protein ACD_16C00172G0002 [uncultured bacterium]|nr:MAG: hypothetical protein ACD_16C00172G0002 [uncultured bacterium]OGN56126.1 MAG: hypothetical protein A2796_01290 [Chlamydiae bacterium RIFCSPHIGHO2_01_FULL_44_39]OGN57386.1 MAG: hypothetical protein A3C42_03515 [Chlamydiae bacterium RIFCSPHIGHO2_02_FULL_45_9]OGN60952.1 MAG: hypothetical protein A3D96_03000 [Chlamydiae bacterium RIFCSPHIGHO2_12_FULL_44_59]OGN66640.1 MAG: hypothetical protein A2978_01500 [Chlamydiae bacterium RIFCSPLOWO2_01_FULL_44_52]OGN69644.1 MAG: hypothetical protein A3